MSMLRFHFAFVMAVLRKRKIIQDIGHVRILYDAAEVQNNGLTEKQWANF